jgi:hypothetical protein
MEKLFSLKQALKNLKIVMNSFNECFENVRFKSDTIEYCDKELEIVNNKIKNFKLEIKK